MSNYIPLEKILFLDIETVPQTYEYAKLDEKTKELFNAKNRFAQNEEKSFEMIYNEKGGILSEFGKIICISIGMIHKTTLGRSMRLKSFAHDDEAQRYATRQNLGGCRAPRPASDMDAALQNHHRLHRRCDSLHRKSHEGEQALLRQSLAG